MSNPSKRKGTEAEVKLLAWMRDHGHPETVRNPPAGAKDVGDLCCKVLTNPGDGVYDPEDDTTWIRPLVIEVKNHANLATAINDGLAELDAEMVNAGTTHGVLVVKRRGKGDPGEWLAIRKVKNDPEIGAS